MSNDGNIWIPAAEEKFSLRLTSSGEHPTSDPVHYSAFDYETSFDYASDGVSAAMITLKFRGSMRGVCDGNNTTDTRICELILDGAIDIADYNGSEVSFNTPDENPPKITRETSKIFVDGVELNTAVKAAHISEGTHTISGEIISENKNGAAYIAVYENDVLKSVAVDNEPDSYINKYEPSLKYKVSEFNPTLEIKLFFWDKDTQMPIHEPAIIKELLYTMPKSENNTMFEEGDVVGFIGDSITHADNMNTPNYMSFIYDYYITRKPNEPIKLVNLGIASYTAGDVLNTFDENVAVGGSRKNDGSAWENINKATIMIGMNDINRGLYNQNSMANNEKQRQEKIDNSNKNTREILEKLNGIGVENNDITIITPSIFDNTKISNATSSNPCFANNGLVILAEKDKELAEEKGTNLVEFNAPMLEINAAYQARNYDGTIIRDDLVHPRGMGHTMMGYLFLRQQGADSDVAVVDLTKDEYKNCDVAVKDKYKNYIEYTYTPKSIPLAASTDYNQADEYVAITNDLNREIIKADLNDGNYKLSIDGVELGTFTDEAFAMGVNIATLSKNPNQIISQEIEKLNIERRNNEIRIRNTWFQEFNKDTVSYYHWVNDVAEYDAELGRFVVDPNYQEKEAYKNAPQGDKNSMDTYAEVKLNPDKFLNAIDDCIEQMYKKAQDAVKTPHTVKIERAGASNNGIQLPNFFTENMVLQRGKINMVCIGDSITEGIGVANAEDKYTARLKKMLNDETNTAYEYNVLNMGVSGTCIVSNGNSPYTNTEKYRKAYFASADIYTIALGTNDSKEQASAMNFSHIDELEKDYSVIIEKIQARNPKAKIYVCIPVPVLNDGEGKQDNGIGINEEYEKQVRKHIRNVAKKYNLDIIDLNQAFLDAFDKGIDSIDKTKYVDKTDNNTGYVYTGIQRYLYDRNAGSNNNDIFVDDIHPGANGAKLIADTIFAKIKGDGLIK